jgi:hypothetical protein
MVTKRKAKEVLLHMFDTAHCFSCASRETKKYCNECHEENICWLLSGDYADRVVEMMFRKED